MRLWLLAAAARVVGAQIDCSEYPAPLQLLRCKKAASAGDACVTAGKPYCRDYADDCELWLSELDVVSGNHGKIFAWDVEGYTRDKYVNSAAMLHWGGESHLLANVDNNLCDMSPNYWADDASGSPENDRCAAGLLQGSQNNAAELINFPEADPPTAVYYYTTSCKSGIRAVMDVHKLLAEADAP